MDNKIEIFKNEQFGEVRTILEGEKVLFCAADVAKALGYTNPNKAVNDHCRAITKRSTPISGKVQSINFIPEGDVYRLIIRSKLPAAEKFELWVFDEVIPTIRKTGGYMTDSLLERIQKEPAVIVEFAQALILEKNRVKALECELNTAKPKADYRGLGSIDFRAAARSVLLIGRVKREPNMRVVIHDKSSLAPEGKPVAFCLDPETGFEWIGEYDITADELLSGAGGNNATKTEQAERLILDLLADGKELASEDIVKAAAEAGISERTVQNAKRNMGGILGARRVGGQWYNFIKKKQPPEPAS